MSSITQERRDSAERDLALRWGDAVDSYHGTNLHLAKANFENCLKLLAIEELSQPKRARFFTFLAHAYLAQIASRLSDSPSFERHFRSASDLGKEFRTPIETTNAITDVITRYESSLERAGKPN